MGVKSSARGILLILVAALGFATAAAKAGTLDEVKARGQLLCGTNPDLTGFGLPDNSGHWSGFDVDYCRAIAAAIFDDPSKVKFIPLKAEQQFEALQSGDIDVLAHTTAWTQSRDTGQGILFTAINFYDGQGFMVHRKLNISSVLELSGASICLEDNTATKLNLADFFNTHQMQYDAIGFATADAAVKAYDGGRCDAYTADSAALYGERISLSNPSDNVILPEIISKEPLSLAVRQGDDQWFNLVKWVHFVMVDAEEAGITSQNVDDRLSSHDPATRRLLGADGNFGAGLGLTKDWAYRIIKLVGNYGEVFYRNLGDGSALKIKRGLNALWSKGGLQYAPPIR